MGVEKLEERFSEEKLIEIWETSRSNWHRPPLPLPLIGSSIDEFPFENYQITIGKETTRQGNLYLENLFDHLIVHYIFCPRSLETAATLSLATLRGLKSREKTLARRMVNIFSDIVADTFRLERSDIDEEKVLLGWKHLAEQDLAPLDRIVLGFLKEYWDVNLPRCDHEAVDMLLHTFSWGVEEKSKWKRQCQQMARILEPFAPGLLGQGQIRTSDGLKGDADAAPFAGLASDIEPGEYKEALAVLGQHADLKRWYRDQSYIIEIEASRKVSMSRYPTAPIKWRFTDPPSELDVAYSMSLSPKLVPGITTFKREDESCEMMAGKEMVPDLLIVLDSSRSMDGHRRGTKTHSATLAAFKAAQFAHQQGAEIAAINFSDQFIIQDWTRDLGAAEDVLVQYIGSRTHIPGELLLNLAKARKKCLILCITDTHIQNLYTEWDYIKEASEVGQFVLFCIDEANKNKQVEEALGSIGTVYYINRLEDLIMLVVDTTKKAYQAGYEIKGTAPNL